MRFLAWIVLNVAALGTAIWLFDGITLTGGNDTDRVVALVVVGGIFGIINSFVKPVVKFFAFPFIILTLGLLLLVINALALLATSRIAEQVGVAFHVDGFGTALLGAIVISIVSAVLGAVLPDGED